MDIKKDSLSSRDPGRSQAVVDGLLGRSGGDVSGRSSDVGELLRTAFGTGNRSRPVDTKAAAASLGVSQRTVQRWLASEGRQRIKAPRAENLKRLQKESKRVVSTKRGRRRTIAAARRRNTFSGSKGIQIRVSGLSGMKAQGNFYMRYRTVPLELPPDQVDQMCAAYEQNGTKGFSDWLTSYADANYLNDWEFEQIDSINFEQSP